MDWDKAESYLKTAESVYAEAGSTGFFAMAYVIRPLRDRFNCGDRSQDLYDEIMDIKL